MSANDLDRRIHAWLIAQPGAPRTDAVSNVMAEIDRSRQRPAWIVAVGRGAAGLQPSARSIFVSRRAIAVVAVVALLLAMLAIAIGSAPPDERRQLSVVPPTASAGPSLRTFKPTPSLRPIPTPDVQPQRVDMVRFGFQITIPPTGTVDVGTDRASFTGIGTGPFPFGDHVLVSMGTAARGASIPGANGHDTRIWGASIADATSKLASATGLDVGDIGRVEIDGEPAEVLEIQRSARSVPVIVVAHGRRLFLLQFDYPIDVSGGPGASGLGDFIDGASEAFELKRRALQDWIDAVAFGFIDLATFSDPDGRYTFTYPDSLVARGTGLQARQSGMPVATFAMSSYPLGETIRVDLGDRTIEIEGWTLAQLRRSLSAAHVSGGDSPGTFELGREPALLWVGLGDSYVDYLLRFAIAIHDGRAYVITERTIFDAPAGAGAEEWDLIVSSFRFR